MGVHVYEFKTLTGKKKTQKLLSTNALVQTTKSLLFTPHTISFLFSSYKTIPNYLYT